jgi:hypothetical protein
LSFFCIELVLASALKIVHEFLLGCLPLCARSPRVAILCRASGRIPRCRARLAEPALAWQWPAQRATGRLPAGSWPWRPAVPCPSHAVALPRCAAVSAHRVPLPPLCSALYRSPLSALRCVATARNHVCVGLAGHRPLRCRRIEVTSACTASRCRGHRLAVYGVTAAHAMLPHHPHPAKPR